MPRYGATIEVTQPAILQQISIDLAGCAVRCNLNPSCKSFDWENPRCSDAEVKRGACVLYVDSITTAIPHTLERAKDVSHYTKYAAMPPSMS